MGMRKKRQTRRCDDVIRVSNRITARTHAIRQRLKNYSAAKKRNVTIAETYCGRERKWGKTKYAGAVDCIACIEALNAR